jgi:DNA-binding transcriptional LysR family regulator
MTLKQLEAFYLAATLGNFSLAAHRAHVTQSSLSKRIAELEVWVGTALFDRSGQRARLTDAGHRLLPMAAQMLVLRDGVRSVQNASEKLVGSCRFGVSELGALTWLPSFVTQMRLENPELMLEPYVDLGRRLEKQVQRGELDFAVVPGLPEGSSIASHVVGEVGCSWFAAPGRLCPEKRTLTPEDLAGHTVIMMTEGSGLTQAFEAWAADQGLRVQRTVASNSLMAIIGLTIADVGLSALPDEFLSMWIEQGKLVKFRSEPQLPSLRYFFIHRADDRRSMILSLLNVVADMAQFSSAEEVSRKTH